VRGVEVDHVTAYRWVQAVTSEFLDAARPSRTRGGSLVRRRNVRQGRRALDSPLPRDRSAWAGHRRPRVRTPRWPSRPSFFTGAMTLGSTPREVTTDRAPVYPRVPDELVPSSRDVLERYANNSVESDHGRFKARLRAMRGSRRSALRARSHLATHSCSTYGGGHYELATDRAAHDRPPAALPNLRSSSERRGRPV
jgi:IS6 family transposase